MVFYFRLRNKLRNRLGNSLLGKVLLNALSKPASGCIHIVSATRMNESDFWSHSALGQSLSSYRACPDLRIHIHHENTVGLSKIYNQHITPDRKHDLLLFIHDDVWFDTENWLADIRKGLGQFDVIGVAGNRRLTAQHPAWLFKSLTTTGFAWDTGFLSGAVGHGKQRGGVVQNYGHYPALCQSLDGVLLAARASSLLGAKVRFDERFNFHFYDLDFCRNANRQGLLLGTWGIRITHQSGGYFGSPAWQEAYHAYLAKWADIHDDK